MPRASRVAPLFPSPASLARVAFAAVVSLGVAITAACGGASSSAPVPVSTVVVADANDAGVALIDAGPPAAVVASSYDVRSPISIDGDTPYIGSPTALVTMVEFGDFQCPFTQRVQDTLARLQDAYGPDTLRIVWRNEPLPFHPNAEIAAEAGEGVYALAGNDAFWKFHDIVFRNQSDLTQSAKGNASSVLVGWALRAGVSDSAAFLDGLSKGTWAGNVGHDHALSKQSGVNGTPAFFVNGVMISGAQPLDKFRTVIDAEVLKAQARLESGVARDQLYFTLTTENFNAPKERPDTTSAPPEDETTVYKVPVGSSPIRGNSATALVTIVEFTDFQCPYCKRVQPTLQQVLQTYGDKVRLVFKNEPLPFHNRAEPAAELAEEAFAEKGTAGFWDAHDKLFAAQPNLEAADLSRVAAASGLSVAKVSAAIQGHKYKAKIAADQSLSEDVAASGTPHFFVNGRRLVGAQPFEKFKALIDEEIAHATEVSAKNGSVKGAALYDRMIKDGKGPAPLERKNFPASSTAPARGNLNAKVVVQEVGDFQCPFCGRAQATLTQVMSTYGTKIRFEWRNLPLSFHADAPLAAEAAMEAFKQKGNAGFWTMHDKLFASQSAPDGLKRAALEQYAQAQGLDMAKFKNALDTSAHKAAIDADAKAADTAGISGTPSFVINGFFISGAQPFAKFQKAIDAALAGTK